MLWWTSAPPVNWSYCLRLASNMDDHALATRASPTSRTPRMWVWEIEGRGCPSSQGCVDGKLVIPVRLQHWQTFMRECSAERSNKIQRMCWKCWRTKYHYSSTPHHRRFVRSITNGSGGVGFMSLVIRGLSPPVLEPAVMDGLSPPVIVEPAVMGGASPTVQNPLFRTGGDLFSH